MATSFEEFLVSHPDLSAGVVAGDGSRRYSLMVPPLPEGRLFHAWLELPKAFPNQASAIIRFSPEHVLKIPHVESDGKLCIDIGDPGPLSGADPIERLKQLLESFFENFITPWSLGWLDKDFALEAINYWVIHCNRSLSDQNAVFKIYTTDDVPDDARICEGSYLTRKRIVFSAKDTETIAMQYVSAMAPDDQIRKVLIAEIPLSHPLTPQGWPNDLNSIHRLLNSRLGRNAAQKFINKTRHRKSAIHKIVLLRAPGCSFGFLLPGGPTTIVRKDNSIRSYPSARMLPIQVERLDPAWTCGRAQFPEVLLRQSKHVLVIGSGALGSSVIEQLAKAGVGKITIIDDDLLSSSNINRHVLGADSIGLAKSVTLARQLATRYPSCRLNGIKQSASDWLQKNTLKHIDLVLDLTGEPDVRMLVDAARLENECSLLIGWFEPYVAAAHACMLPKGIAWLNGEPDRLKLLQAVEWPSDVLQREPSCSSTFQSYTPAAATYGVALVSESALDMLDNKTEVPIVRHWIRGQKFLDKHRPGLVFQPWAINAASFDGITMERPL